MMSPLIPVSIAAAAGLLAYRRARRLAARPPLPARADPRPLALAEAAASAFTVLLVGWILAASIAPAPWYLPPTFTIIAIGICLSQYRKTIRARSG